MGEANSLTAEARQAIRESERVFATPRLAGMVASLHAGVRAVSHREILEELRRTQDCGAAVVVSGDTGFYSLAGLLEERLNGVYHIRRIPGISSLQVLCARVGIGYEDVNVVSTHGRSLSLMGPVSYNEKVFALTSGGEDVWAICTQLLEADLPQLEIWAGESLGCEAERICHGDPASLTEASFSGPVSLLIRNPDPCALHGRLRDRDFTQGKVPMTKEAVRVLALNRLEVAPGDVVYDVGAGTGSVSCALAKAACNSMVYAIERTAEGAGLIRQNRQRIGAHNITIIEGSAPEALEPLPTPDKVFIGGSGGNLDEIIEKIRVKGKPFTACVNAITIETLSRSIACLEKSGFSEVEIDCVNLSSARKAGSLHMMEAQNPVYIISGRCL